jgi:8-oxo-dGTP pyrophosphatase MutT (NUDIX family)
MFAIFTIRLMESKAEIVTLLKEYARKYAGEQKEVTEIISFVAKNNDKNLFDRKNFDGHVTASAFIINSNRDSLLFIRHKFLQKWLQPGGHVDFSDASLIAAAQREAMEETGLSPEDLRVLSDDIFDIDSHSIPKNIKKQELAHIHHDLRFLFQTSKDIVSFTEEESTGSKWVPLSELATDKEFSRVAGKIQLEEL